MDALRRLECFDELALAREEALRLSEMLSVLSSRLDEAHRRQLRIELRVVQARIARISEELAADPPGSAAA